MVAITNVLALAGSAAALVTRQTTSQVLSDLKTVDTNVNNLNTQFVNYAGGSDLSSITSAANTLNVSISTTTKDTNSTPGPVSASDANSILTYVNNPLTPDINTLIKNVVAKKSKFSSSNQALVLFYTKSLRSNTNSLSQALISKAPAASKAAASSASSSIDVLFASAVSAYGG